MLPFEIHVTVQLTSITIDQFKTTCSAIGVKPIVIDVNTGVLDVMTSSTIITDNDSVYHELNRIKKGLAEYGFNVIREKIETVPWHPVAPTTSNAMPQNCYFECHFNVRSTIDRNSTLKQLSDAYQCHMSKNVFKHITDTEFYQMITVRSYSDSTDDFTMRVAKIKNELTSNQFFVEKTIVEFALYDSNVSHDNQWLNYD